MKSLMAKWLEQAFQWCEMHCYDIEVMSSNPGRAELGVRSTSVASIQEKLFIAVTMAT